MSRDTDKEKRQDRQHGQGLLRVETPVVGQRPHSQLSESFDIKLNHSKSSLDFTLGYSIEKQFKVYLRLSAILLAWGNHSVALK